MKDSDYALMVCMIFLASVAPKLFRWIIVVGTLLLHIVLLGSGR